MGVKKSDMEKLCKKICGGEMLHKRIEYGSGDLEFDFCFQLNDWALPLAIDWRGHQKNSKNDLLNFFMLNVWIFCFSFHFTWWK